MIRYDVKQGSDQWHELRIGIPTASEYDRIITSKKWESTSGETRRKYLLVLTAELIYRIPRDKVVTPAMIHGHDWEPKARAAYEMQYGVDAEEIGFCTNDEGTTGASPDSFIGSDGSLEIKCPLYPHNHLGYVMSPQTLEDEYWVQVQGQLYITGRKWTDLFSYFQGMPNVVRRITPHHEFQTKLDAALKLFINDQRLYVDAAKTKGVKFFEESEDASTAYPADWVTDEDAEAQIALNRLRDQSNAPQGA